MIEPTSTTRPAMPAVRVAHRISPTDVSQFIRLDQCQRYLALRLKERAEGRGFMTRYGVAPQSIPPILTRAGADFEEKIEKLMKQNYQLANFQDEATREGQRPPDNQKVVTWANDLKPGEVVCLFQVRLEVQLGHWDFRGDLDILRFERDKVGDLHVLIADMKSSTRPKTEHRLQVAFYHAMLAELLQTESIAYNAIQTAILYRGATEAEAGLDETEIARLENHRVAALHYFGLEIGDGLLEIIEKQQDFLESVEDLVTGPNSQAEKIVATSFEDTPYHLTNKCTGCLYNEHCMKFSAEHDDLSLIPHLNPVEKEALRRQGITTTRALAALKNLVPPAQLVAAPDKAELVRQLAGTWPVGPRIDELVHRALRYRKLKKEAGDPGEALTYIPSKGHGSLPYTDPTHNPNLVRIFIDAQQDYLQNRLYLVGALVVGGVDGQPDPTRRRSIVRLSDGPPDSHLKEAELLRGWIMDTLKALLEVAAPDPAGERKAPIHLIFYNRADQKVLLEGLARHLTDLFGATPLYDFITQIAAFDSPICTFMDEEIRELKNYPMLCQSLQQVATHLRFDWRQGHDFRAIFRERMFDYWGKLDSPDPETAEQKWYNNRARFNSEIPIEYAYAIWGELDETDLKKGRQDPFAPYRRATKELLEAFQARRLEAIEHIAHDFQGNRLTEKALFNLPDLANFNQKARSLAHALQEFVTIEHHVELGGWKTTRNLAPERRVLMGESLLVRYVEDEQDPAAAAQNRENLRKVAEAEKFKAENPDQRLPSELYVKQAGLNFTLQIAMDGVDCSLDDAMAMCNLREGERVVVFPRWTQDTRLSAEERTDNTPTPRQMLYGSRAEIKKIKKQTDDAGKTSGALVEVEMQEGRGGKNMKGFAFNSIDRPFGNDQLLCLDPEPNNFYGYWCAVVTDGLCEIEEGRYPGARNTLYERLARPGLDTVGWPTQATEGQQRFMDGLNALHQSGALHDFEPSKEAYIGGHGADPVLLVQGPPGTGKSYSTAFALFARLQGAMVANQPFRTLITCKTHAATDVLLHNVLMVQQLLGKFSREQPEIFTKYFDRRLLTEVPLYRLAPREEVPAGVIGLTKDVEKAKGEVNNTKTLQSRAWMIAAATPGGIYSMVKNTTGSKKENLFKQHFIDCLVLDEASQMNLPEAAMAALPLKSGGQLIVVGDHRQMSPIIKHDWENESRRTFQEYRSYDSLFNSLRALQPPVPMIKFSRSFRLHAAMAEFLRQEIYAQDGIDYHSLRQDTLRPTESDEPFVRAVLNPNYPLVVLLHDEAGSQTHNQFEEKLVGPVLEAMHRAGLDATDGLGVVVPHRAQRAALQQRYPDELTELGPDGNIIRKAVDTVERYQGDERLAIMVSATESDRDYLLMAGDFLYDPCRLTVAISRAKQKMILVASRSVFSLFSPDEAAFANARMWKNLLRRTCTVQLWAGERDGIPVEVWGNLGQDAP